MTPRFAAASFALLAHRRNGCKEDIDGEEAHTRDYANCVVSSQSSGKCGDAERGDDCGT